MINIPENLLRRVGWVRGAGGAWYYSFDTGVGSREVTNTHLHIVGSNVGGQVRTRVIAVKVDDTHIGEYYRDHRTPEFNHSLLEGPDVAVAIDFRKALNSIGANKASLR